ncbi:MAG: inverse autotransporter beta domain-containing protein [Alphaproteobacteria bacterium]|nr:inverse autotransporter beta domain-containing protein [Alphaproteobacteria bacterium]
MQFLRLGGASPRARIRAALAAAVMGCLMARPAAAPAADPVPKPATPEYAAAEAPRPATPMDRAALEFLQVADRGDVELALQMAAATLARDGVDYWFDGLGAGAPDWAKRIEVELDVQRHNKPEFSILTVQPLYQDEGLTNTVFLQGRAAAEHRFGERRIAHNLGLGYRRLLMENSAMLGVNAFHDYEWDYDHSRASVGLEARWGPVDLFANQYWALSGKHSAGDGVTEAALDGRDLIAAVQAPYLPWLRAKLRRYQWDALDAADDINGWAGSMEADLHQSLQLEAGVVDDNSIDREAFLELRFRLAEWGGNDRPVAFSDRIVDDTPFDMRDMRVYTLDKVMREDSIIVERAAAGVTISRGS